jgi:hypothetical protein
MPTQTIKRSIFLFIHVESVLPRATSGPEAFTKPRTHQKRIPALVQLAFRQKVQSDESWYVIFYTSYGERYRSLVQQWLATQHMWNESPRPHLLMKDAVNQAHIPWTVDRVQQMSAELSPHRSDDICHVFDRTGQALQDLFNQQNRSQHADTIVYVNPEELTEDLQRVLAESQEEAHA